MFSKTRTMTSIGAYWEQIKQLKYELTTADAIIVGAGAGLSSSAGFLYDGERFKRHFSDFEKACGFHDMYTGGFYPYESPEEYWAFWSRHIWINRYDTPPGIPYLDLRELLNGKNYFVLTTNVDHQFQLAGFDKDRLFYTQGDYGLWQCSVPCHYKTYDNKEAVRQMIQTQKNMRIPSEQLPFCPVCGAPMTMNLRCDDHFVQDEGWYAAAARYNDFIRQYKDSHILFLELGVGFNTPGIIKYPFWQMTAENGKAVYGVVNCKEAYAPKEIRERSLCIYGDIQQILYHLRFTNAK